MSRTLRVVAYAVNGSGVGHLTRLHGIARWIRRYAAAAGVRPEISFLTSCEADSILFGDRFPSFKLPSKTVINDAGFDKLTYLGLAKQWVWHSLALLRPDLLIVDTFPRGAYGELLGALDLVRRKAFVYRPTKAAFAGRADFQAMLPLYDLVVVPDSRDEAKIQIPATVQGRLRFVGPVISRERCELLPRDVARAELGIGGERLAVLVSAGGGGDPGVDDHLATVHRALGDDDSIHLVLAAGPLHRGKPIRGPRVTWIDGPALAERMLAFDVAICAAGYNTFHEVMLAGIPALFVPQEKIADEQHARAERAIAVGAAAMVELTVDGLREGLARFRDRDAREAASNAARSLVPASNAREAAAEMLRLVLNPHEVDAAEEIVTDEVLANAPSLDALLQVLRTLCGGEATARHVPSALAVSRALDRAAVPPTHQLRIVELVTRKLAAATPDERAGAICSLIESFRPFADWNGAAILLSVLQTERQLAPTALVDRLSGFLTNLHARRGDLYQGVGELSRASAGAEPGTNEALLRSRTEET
jgi:UDP-N-acetylglucosamine--N-acetylmuramyl-(pentapeptide) pyrophosphoryl-undecaprenol N-acetylglucosamine transferase